MLPCASRQGSHRQIRLPPISRTRPCRRSTCFRTNPYCWNQTTRSGNISLGRIANKAQLSQWFTDSDNYTIQPAIEYNNKFGKNAVSGLFLYEFSRTNEESLSGGRSDFPSPTSWISIMVLKWTTNLSRRSQHCQAFRLCIPGSTCL